MNLFTTIVYFLHDRKVIQEKIKGLNEYLNHSEDPKIKDLTGSYISKLKKTRSLKEAISLEEEFYQYIRKYKYKER
ncbi:MAG: hypothetical protein KDK54_20305 [Leptospiraceae bacterium]|nr:hypothetical protein [Leptospiraceae bacterium]